MDRDRIEGSGTKMKGDLKEAAGRVTGDQKLQQEGAMDKVKGKIQNAIGGIKDALRGHK
ncbi:CsbD family protein [Azospirillum sp. TSO22-1]|uniref:CsbD family protein n=1 Tax=Azospirillum sp. TSO22-1 TaxID=716789 RepID=UPI000D60EB01|nr:CsbD family protein [Azospirillum sp. TSO22-1]PWC53227.1 CsbD-like protein [Azospirillum sp. TSO22-1]